VKVNSHDSRHPIGVFELALQPRSAFALPEATGFAEVFLGRPCLAVKVQFGSDDGDDPATASLHEFGEEDGGEVI